VRRRLIHGGALNRPTARLLALASLACGVSGCAATKSWWYAETGRMTESEAASHGYPDCAGLTLASCGRKHPQKTPAPAESREPAVSK
jgi:hypothetical protein